MLAQTPRRHLLLLPHHCRDECVITQNELAQANRRVCREIQDLPLKSRQGAPQVAE